MKASLILPPTWLKFEILINISECLCIWSHCQRDCLYPLASSAFLINISLLSQEERNKHTTVMAPTPHYKYTCAYLVNRSTCSDPLYSKLLHLWGNNHADANQLPITTFSSPAFSGGDFTKSRDSKNFLGIESGCNSHPRTLFSKDNFVI